MGKLVDMLNSQDGAAFDAFTTKAALEAAYQRGVETGREVLRNGGEFAVAINGCWSAHWRKDNVSAHISSDERIGYHSGSKHFFRGVLTTGCRVVVYEQGEPSPTVLVP